jgi:hypothetical protein
MNDISLVLDKITKERDIYLKRGLELASYPHQSAEVNEVFTAFAQAQASFPNVVKDTQGYGYKYADLSAVLRPIIPILAEHGMHFTQYTTRKNILHTRIGHSSGQYFESQCEMPFPRREEFTQVNKKTSYAQELGSIRTYTRRYEALALLGLQPAGEDNDNG